MPASWVNESPHSDLALCCGISGILSGTLFLYAPQSQVMTIVLVSPVYYMTYSHLSPKESESFLLPGTIHIRDMEFDRIKEYFTLQVLSNIKVQIRMKPGRIL